MIKALKNYLRKSNFLIVFIFLKRLKIVLKKFWKSLLLNFFWLIKSKEHTNFSFEINDRSLLSLKYYLKNNFDFSINEVNDVVEYALQTKIKKVILLICLITKEMIWIWEIIGIIDYCHLYYLHLLILNI